MEFHCYAQLSVLQIKAGIATCVVKAEVRGLSAQVIPIPLNGAEE